jgi:hypothetical protein
MDNLTSQKANDRIHEVSFDEPETGTGGSGGKTPGSASAGEVAFDEPETGTGGSGGKTPGSASAGEN